MQGLPKADTFHLAKERDFNQCDFCSLWIRKVHQIRIRLVPNSPFADPHQEKHLHRGTAFIGHYRGCPLNSFIAGNDGLYEFKQHGIVPSLQDCKRRLNRSH